MARAAGRDRAAGAVDDEERRRVTERRYVLPAATPRRCSTPQPQPTWPRSPFTVGLLRPLTLAGRRLPNGRRRPLPAYGPDTREGQADANRATFLRVLGTAWFPAVPDVHARLAPAAPRPRRRPRLRERAGRASRSPAPTRMRGSTASTRTRRRSRRPAPTPRGTASGSACASSASDAADSELGRGVRPRDGLRVPPRHGPAGRGPGEQAGGSPRRRGARRRRAGGGAVPRARRRPAPTDVRLLRRPLPRL